MLPSTRRLIIAFHSLLLSGSIYAQSASQTVLGTSGASSTAITGYTIDYTVGEAVIETVGSGPVLTQGFHQPLSSAPLPVRLLYFTARGQNEQSVLTWKTAIETNNRFFAVERSGDGLHFTVLDTVASKAPGGNSSMPLEYSYTDRQPLLKNFYRIRQVDIDGQFSYSIIAIVSFDINNQWLLYTYSNPAQQQLNLVMYSAEATVANCTITNVTGQVVLSQKLVLNSGSNRYTMSVQALPAGLFFIRLENPAKNWLTISKFVKQ